MYAIDLNPRQSMRTLEQAIRHQVSVAIDPRYWSQSESLIGRLESIESQEASAALLCVVIEPATESAAPSTPYDSLGRQPNYSFLDQLTQLVGTYCDVVLQLGQNRYLFSTDIMRVEGPQGQDGSSRIYLSRPQFLQVAQRRRHWRFQSAKSAQVQLRWEKDKETTGTAVAWLCNISGDGMACRTDGGLGDQLWIGDLLVAEFHLSPGDAQRYVLDAILCNKTPAGSEGKLILGLQFLTGPGYESTTRATHTLRQQLLTRQPVPMHTPKSAGA